LTGISISRKAILAGARVAPLFVYTLSTFVAIVFTLALIDVNTLFSSCSSKPFSAVTFVTTKFVCTNGVLNALVVPGRTFVNIAAAKSISAKPFHTLAVEGPLSIYTFCILTAVMGFLVAFINVATNGPGSTITYITSAAKAIHQIGTFCIFVTVMGPRTTLVHRQN
jgi:hypothetical protein